MEDFERSRVEAFFRRVTTHTEPARKPSSLLITHLLPERPIFVAAVSRLSAVAAVLPKPKSIDAGAMKEVTRMLRCDALDRRQLADPEQAVAYLESRAAGQALVLLDIGGYFAPALEEICANFSGRLLGVVEDTENGLQRYLEHDKLPCPVFTVARSPLKDPEDYLVGQSVVFSTEALIRSRGGILHGRHACVIGFGKVGASIARMLHAKHVQVTVYDTDPVRMAQALSQGFRTATSRAQALAGAGVVICATGNLALRADDFARVSNGAYIASVTSSDDELELDALDGLYDRATVTASVTRHATTGHYFYVLNDGNAVNFLHGASVGSFIYLVQAEILAALALLADRDHDPGLHDIPADIRKFIAATWLHYFNGST
ncbi:adenosylhomocysteinase [Acrocarpospora macrocephala]|uniref:Adenosylhomocysteinase n=1 Tax=Acrocarpospora macrocephala TaxID=150177 RepID=A0A5M3WS30_9ACTN|nr:adenosylhomocysteinase [Acrocarpospora macrocephala]GES10962.1 adenosylhomocysteinase [Acrocarpospora macrocephala]